MYNNTLQLNWKLGHIMPLTTIDNNADNTSPTSGITSNVALTTSPALTSVIPPMHRQTSANPKKLNKKIISKRSLVNHIGGKNTCDDPMMVNNLSRSNLKGNANTTEKSSGPKKSKNKSYTLRACSIQKRLETEHRTKLPRKRGPKPRPKTAPMSKYRRRTANLRERQRMGEINVAFDGLREKLPSPISLKNGGKCEKLTKINILHIAINYIRAMENLLKTGDSGVNSFKDMVKNPIRDDQDRKMEVQRVLEALMKRADNISSGSSSMANLRRLATARNSGSNRSKNSSGSSGGSGVKRKNISKTRKVANSRNESSPNDGASKNKVFNDENFHRAEAVSFLMSTMGVTSSNSGIGIDQEEAKSSGTSDDEEEESSQPESHFENVIMFPEWTELSSTLDLNHVSNNDTKIDIDSTHRLPMPNIFSQGDEEKGERDRLFMREYSTRGNSNNLARAYSFENGGTQLENSTTNSTNVASTSVNVTNSTTDLSGGGSDTKSYSSLLLELMPIPQPNNKRQHGTSCPSQTLIATKNIPEVNTNCSSNEISPTMSSSSFISISPNSSNSSLSSNSCLSSTINSPVSPSISLFKEPDPLFASIALNKTSVMKPAGQMIQQTMQQTNENAKHRSRSNPEIISYGGSLNAVQNYMPVQQHLQQHQQQQQQHPQNHVKENNNHLISGSVGVNSSDDIMMKDFTDFVEMVDSLNGMPDIEFVEDNFEMFP